VDVVVVGGSEVVVVVGADTTRPWGESMIAFPQCSEKKNALNPPSTAMTKRSTSTRRSNRGRRSARALSLAIDPVSRSR
jgi:hypothetical protein